MEQPASLATMQEPALSFEGVTLSPQKETVRIFYKDMWDHADKSLIPKIFHEGFTFRGSLGPTLVGHDQFAGYGGEECGVQRSWRLHDRRSPIAEDRPT
jgi:hypothetical protein